MPAIISWLESLRLNPISVSFFKLLECQLINKNTMLDNPLSLTTAFSFLPVVLRPNLMSGAYTMLHPWRCDPLNNFSLWFELNTKISRPTLCLWTCIFPWANICAYIPLAPKSIDWIHTEIEKRTTLNSRPVQLSIHTALTAHSCQFLERNFHIIRSPFPHSTQTSTKSTGQYSKLISALRLLHCLKCLPPIQKTKQITHSKKKK